MSKREELTELLAPHMHGRPYIECGEGWDELIERLHRKLVALSPAYAIHQVKEKYAGLRFYIGEVDDAVFPAVEEAISAAESASERTCEICGNPGTVSAIGGWVKAVCPEHFELLSEDRRKTSREGAKFEYDVWREIRESRHRMQDRVDAQKASLQECE